MIHSSHGLSSFVLFLVPVVSEAPLPPPPPPPPPISTDHIFVLGDDSRGIGEPHSTAIAVGKKRFLLVLTH